MIFLVLVLAALCVLVSSDPATPTEP